MWPTIESEFQSYLRAAYGQQQLGPTQLQELRRAFFAGCWLALQRADCVNAQEVEEHAKWEAECREFKQDVLDGKK